MLTVCSDRSSGSAGLLHHVRRSLKNPEETPRMVLASPRLTLSCSQLATCSSSKPFREYLEGVGGGVLETVSRTATIQLNIATSCYTSKLLRRNKRQEPAAAITSPKVVGSGTTPKIENPTGTVAPVGTPLESKTSDVPVGTNALKSVPPPPAAIHPGAT